MNIHQANQMDADEAAPILAAREGAVLIVTLNRPQAMNALSMPLLDALAETLAEVEADKTIRAVIIAGGGKAFSAGHDLREITAQRTDEDGGRAFYEALFSRCTDVMLAIRNLPVAVIAEVDGIATAAGCQLAATCDMIIASERARFGVNGVDAGLFCSTPMVALSRNIPEKAAMEMLVLGEIIEAQRALDLGLVNRVVPSGRLRGAAMAFAERAARKSRAVISLGKKAFYEQRELPLEEAYERMKKVIVGNMMMADACEGIDAFLKKRPPDWQDS